LPFTPHFFILPFSTMTATYSIQRLWRVALCLLAAAVPVDAGGYQRFGFFSGQDRLEAIRDGLAKNWRRHPDFLMPVLEGGMNSELPAGMTDTLWFGFYGPALASGPFDFIKVSELSPHTTDYDKLVIQVLRECEAWKSHADRLLLESLSGHDDPGFFTVIEWHMNRPEE